MVRGLQSLNHSKWTTNPHTTQLLSRICNTQESLKAWQLSPFDFATVTQYCVGGVMMVKSEILAVISNMLSISLFFIRFVFHPKGIYVTSLTLKVLEPMQVCHQYLQRVITSTALAVRSQQDADTHRAIRAELMVTKTCSHSSLKQLFKGWPSEELLCCYQPPNRKWDRQKHTLRDISPYYMTA